MQAAFFIIAYIGDCGALNQLLLEVFLWVSLNICSNENIIIDFDWNCRKYGPFREYGIF